MESKLKSDLWTQMSKLVESARIKDEERLVKMKEEGDSKMKDEVKNAWRQIGFLHCWKKKRELRSVLV